ncbi:MAG TPA: PilZ domain-containing protein [Gemmatimonadaceae bacterium]|nr:PilZ domain-containing protein [Gemmatimonadaceae bacterium]
MSEPSRREQYRIQYPQAERPTLEIGRLFYEVLDCSEGGLRYEVRLGRPLPVPGSQISATLAFRRGEELDIVGEVLRVGADFVVLHLEPPLPYSEILAEQRYLRARGYLLKG